MSFDIFDVSFFDRLEKQKDEPDKTPIDCVREYLGLGVKEVSRGTFLDGIRALKIGADAILGPSGGVFVLNEFGNFAYRQNIKLAICLSADDFLGEWIAIKLT
jgi:hypothetical protein